MARFQPRDVFWRKKYSGSNSAVVKSSEADVKEAPIIGVVDEDKLITLRDCLVGWSRKFLKMKELAAIMHKEGILVPKIMRLSGLAILIIFEDEESRDYTLKNQIGALNKCFVKVDLWSENFQCSSRRAWLSCKGIPPFVWCHSAFRNIAEKWGALISIDEGTVNPGSFDRACFQIITNRKDRLEESCVLKVGEQSFTVFVPEFEPCFSPDSVWIDSSMLETSVAAPLPTEGELCGVSPFKPSELVVDAGTISGVNLDSTNIKEVQLETRACFEGTHSGGGMCGSGAEDVGNGPCFDEVRAVEIVSPTVRYGTAAHGSDCQLSGTFNSLEVARGRKWGLMCMGISCCFVITRKTVMGKLRSMCNTSLAVSGRRLAPIRNVGSQQTKVLLNSNRFLEFPIVSSVSGTAVHEDLPAGQGMGLSNSEKVVGR
ncbi:hypothetical protein F3Y22_tig00011079pilonHSYRG00091 [Hibiscus syriacus]|uniref:Uncharacterized protein n=1 Tax=Hibiscus syriacus TaxID=106335 RepID=A0A6A3C462_HIBSY|nr:hypothetical protein F3Y22_tig00011079pilonHSYRG00091 [Hibiscus syriacus]